jgi:small subunit ribosomal protein S8
MYSDPISDLLCRVFTASKALLPQIELPHSKLKESIVKILKDEGYINDYSVEGDKKKILKIKLKYSKRQGVIEAVKRVSKPGCRVYAGAKEIPKVRGGLGTVIMSTPKGVITGREAAKLRVGGEVICYIW